VKLRGRENKKTNSSKKENMKKPLLTIAALAFLAGTPALVRAADTNSPASSAKKAAMKPYPLKKCIVSDEKLGEMGKPVVLIYEGQEMKFCCKDCVKKFKKEPAKYLMKLAEEVKKQKETK
jgi:hypothetical protein